MTDFKSVVPSSPNPLLDALRAVMDPRARVLVDLSGRGDAATRLARHSGFVLGIVAFGPGLAPPVAWRVRRAGLGVCVALLAVPSPQAPRRLVAWDRHVLARVVAGTARGRGLARLVLRTVPGAALPARLGPGLLVVGRQETAWASRLQALVPAADPTRIAVSASRGHGGVIAVWGAHGREPIAYLKAGDVQREALALARVRRDVEAAGGALPHVLACDGDALATGALPGVSAASALRRRPGRLAEVVGRIVTWLTAWHARASVSRRVAPGDVEHHVLAPARHLAAHLHPAYLPWLERRFRPLERRRAAFAPAHQDLTMLNVLLDGRRLVVLDWEATTMDALPFVDAPYAIADAVAASASYADRLAAFERCFGERHGEDAGVARAACAQIASVARADPLALSAAFHACWVGHAVNDLRSEGSSGAFVRIAARVSGRPERYDPFAV